MATRFRGHRMTNRDPDHKGGEFMENNEVPSPLPKHSPMSQRVGSGGNSQGDRDDDLKTPSDEGAVQERKAQISHEQGRNKPPCRGKELSYPKMLSRIDEEDIFCELDKEGIFQILFSELSGHLPQRSGVAASCSLHTLSDENHWDRDHIIRYENA